MPSHLTLIIGPMFSGKSSELLRRLRRHELAGRTVAVFKYESDLRYSSDEVVSHNGAKREARPFSQLSESVTEDVIGIDEVQFLEGALAIVERLLCAGKTVVAAGLDSTFQIRPFPETLALIPHAETVLKLHAVCMVCGGDASFSKRISNEEQVEVIGGSDKYIACCRACFAPTIAPTVGAS